MAMTKKEQLNWLLEKIDEEILLIESGITKLPISKITNHYTQLKNGGWVEKVEHISGLQVEIQLPDTGTLYKIFGFTKEDLVDSLKRFKVKLAKSQAFKSLRPNTVPKV